MSREEMVKVLEEIALLLELKDENPFKVQADDLHGLAPAAYSGKRRFYLMKPDFRLVLGVDRSRCGVPGR